MQRSQNAHIARAGDLYEVAVGSREPILPLFAGVSETTSRSCATRQEGSSGGSVATARE